VVVSSVNFGCILRSNSGKMNMTKIVTSFLCYIFIITAVLTTFGVAVKEKCSTCKDIVDHFKEV